MARILDPKILDVVRRVTSKAAPTATGAGAAAGAAVVAGSATVALRKQADAEKAKDSPIAKAAPRTITKDCTNDKKCDVCPADSGEFRIQNTTGWSELSISYQHRICGLPVAEGNITEWWFNGVSFDGFDSSECMLKEAKARYDQFFDMWGGLLTFWEKGADKLIDEAMRQGAAAAPRPPVRLRWHFMEPRSYRYFSVIIQAAYPDVEVLLRP